MEDVNISNPTTAARPIPKPRPRASPRKPTEETDINSKPIISPTKPVIAKKPKPPVIAAKPKIPPPIVNDKPAIEKPRAAARPLSVKLNNGKIAGELASILSRPRSTSKGLLSPTKYDQTGSGVTDHRQTESDAGGHGEINQRLTSTVKGTQQNDRGTSITTGMSTSSLIMFAGLEAFHRSHEMQN